MKSVFSSTKRSCSMHCPVLLRHLIQNTGVKIVYMYAMIQRYILLLTFSYHAFPFMIRCSLPFQRPSSSHGARSSPVQSKLRQVETLLSAQARDRRHCWGINHTLELGDNSEDKFIQHFSEFRRSIHKYVSQLSEDEKYIQISQDACWRIIV